MEGKSEKRGYLSTTEGRNATVKESVRAGSKKLDRNKPHG